MTLVLVPVANPEGSSLAFQASMPGCGFKERAVIYGGFPDDVPKLSYPHESHSVPPSERVNRKEERLRVSALILAGGVSRRMGGVNKLLAIIDGKPLLRRVVDTVSASAVDDVVVVTGFEAGRVRQAAEGQGARFVHNPDFTEGLSSSLKTGIRALPVKAAGALVVLGDMPHVLTASINGLVARFKESGGRSICVPTCQGRRGNPVLWPRDFFPEILGLSGDIGARHLIDKFKDRVEELPVDDAGIFVDIDTPADIHTSRPI